MTRPDLSLVVPAYNEQDRLPASLAAIREYLSSRGLDAEVMVIDDGSHDGTAEVVAGFAREWPALRLLSLGTNRGKGAAVRLGIQSSRGERVAFADADLSAPIHQLDALLADLDLAEVAIVSRALAGAQLLRRQSWLRETMGRIYAKLAQALLLWGVPDAHCGLKAYRGELARAVFRDVREDGVLFDIEALLIATLRGARISQRPAIWEHEPNSRIRFGLERGWGVALALARIKWRHRIAVPVRARGPGPSAATTTMSPSHTGSRHPGAGARRSHPAP